jgi:hypothetical protein
VFEDRLPQGIGLLPHFFVKLALRHDFPLPISISTTTSIIAVRRADGKKPYDSVSQEIGTHVRVFILIVPETAVLSLFMRRLESPGEQHA